MDELAAWLERIGVEHPRGVLRGLDGVRDVVRRLALDAPAPTNIVVAGTNGKGSTVRFIERLMLAGGHSPGTTTSPHLHVFNERIRIDGENASDAAIVAAFEAVEAGRGSIDLSYFEYAVLAALHVIKAAQSDYAVLEVGLGGRLDAVNAVDADVAVLTNIGLDHQEYLGDTREAIGAEKAGILRAAKPVVVGEPDPPASVLRRAAALGAPVFLAGRDFGYRHTSETAQASKATRPGEPEEGKKLPGGHLWIKDGTQRLTFAYPDGAAIHPANAAAGLAAARLAGCALNGRIVAEAAASAHNPGRFEILRRGDRIWALDVAHNAAGAAFFAKQARARFDGRPIAAVVACLRDKDVAGIVAALEPVVCEIAYADTQTARGRSAASLRDAVGDANAFAGSLAAAMQHLSRAERGNDVILVCGSFDVVERARIRLGADLPFAPKRSQQTC